MGARRSYKTTTPFGRVLSRNYQTFPVADTSVVVVLPGTSSSRNGRLYVIGLARSSTSIDAISTPSDLTQLAVSHTATGFNAVYYVIGNGTETDTQTFSGGDSSVSAVAIWEIDNHGSSINPPEASVGVATSASSASLNIASLDPTWGSTADNILWLLYGGVDRNDSDPNVTVFPDGFIYTGENRVGGSSIAGVVQFFGEQSLKASSLDPSAITYGPGRAGGFCIAVRPLDLG